MKALTIWNPWASLIVMGAKPYEFRGYDYRTRYKSVAGQRIVIHAGAHKIDMREINEIFERIEAEESALKHEIAIPLLTRLRNAHSSNLQRILPMSAGLGTAIIGDPLPVGELFEDVADSTRLDHSKWAWPMLDIKMWMPPVPHKGAQGFWNWPDGLMGDEVS